MKLAALERGRQHALDRLVEAAHGAGIGALLLIGSLGRGGGDAWSDLDLIAVPGDWFSGLDLADLFGSQVLASVKAPRNAPIGGDCVGVCLEVSGLPLWVDWYQWPPVTAAIPADGTAIFDCLGLPASNLTFIPLIEAHSDQAAQAHTDTAVATLLRAAVAAKYLARGDLVKLAAKVTATQGLSISDAAAVLRQTLDGLNRPDLIAAVAATRALIDIAQAARA
ncbi:hypothetical protein [Catelliglobosispora koreensis]|uniref:hypothetical protein n=1 Tax=Catelliglobosispora koreensis TaxID=129052 RepID=UPI0003689E30|nr:hypothetical protein [Catelliglobosispora koreensis]